MLLTRKRVLAAKIETTVGTAISVTGTDASFNVWDLLIQPEIDVVSREGQAGFGQLAAIVGGYKAKATFKSDTGWDGTSTEPSWADTFLPACGLVKSGGNQFYPVTEGPGSNVKTLTMYSYQDGMIKGICGAVGTGKLICKTGEPAYWDWTFSGIWIPPTDGSILAPTYPTALPLRYANSTTTYNSVALCLENITLDIGNVITYRECASTVGGYHSAIITDRNPKVTGNPEAKLVATRDSYGNFLASTEAALTWNLDGPTNSTITIAAPKAQITKITEGSRNKLVTDEIEWQCNRNASTADQEFSILFTAAS